MQKTKEKGTTTEVISSEQIAVVKTKIDAMKEKVSAIQVSSTEELQAVAGYVKDIKTMKKFVEQERDKYITPAKEIIAKAKEQYDPYARACDEAEYALKEKAQVYMLAEQKKEEAGKAKILADGRTSVETKVKKLETIPEAVKTAKTDNGSLTMKMVKDIRILDESKIPDEYYKPRELDLVKIKRVAIAGLSIPGVEVYEKPQMASK